MKLFVIKQGLAKTIDLIGVNRLGLYLLNKKYRNNYIRVVNYHDIKKEHKDNFEKQLNWFFKKFENVNEEKFKLFMDRKYKFKEKPGLMISFDDGLLGNYIHALHSLNKVNFTGYFFVSPDLIGLEGYMDKCQIEKMIVQGHVIGSHTSTHHRMSKDDTDELLNYEIIESKNKLEEIFDKKIDMFCWCGGEERTYTKKAAIFIKKNYTYSFMTNSFPLTNRTDFHQIGRTNCEDFWSMCLLKFQVGGIIDFKSQRKRKRVEKLTRIE